MEKELVNIQWRCVDCNEFNSREHVDINKDELDRFGCDHCDYVVGIHDPEVNVIKLCRICNEYPADPSTCKYCKEKLLESVEKTLGHKWEGTRQFPFANFTKEIQPGNWEDREPTRHNLAVAANRRIMNTIEYIDIAFSGLNSFDLQHKWETFKIIELLNDIRKRLLEKSA